MEITQERSNIGGSAVEVVVKNPLTDYPYALLTVLFRPFLFEVSSPVQLLSALEGTALLGWMIFRRSEILSSVRLSASVPWIRMSLLYVLAFGFAWSSVGNLGIIVRQRVQVLPLLLVLVFAASSSARIERREGDDSC